MEESKLTRERVANEVEIHWQLKHPSILELLDYFEDRNNVYLVMELCRVGELYRYIKQRGGLREDEARRFLQQVVGGLAYLHGHGIIHRDLKLANILLTEKLEVVRSIGLSRILLLIGGVSRKLPISVWP